jgi:uncharacterized protein YlxW (UPF0749 family)
LIGDEEEVETSPGTIVPVVLQTYLDKEAQLLTAMQSKVNRLLDEIESLEKDAKSTSDPAEIANRQATLKNKSESLSRELSTYHKYQVNVPGANSVLVTTQLNNLRNASSRLAAI